MENQTPNSNNPLGDLFSSIKCYIDLRIDEIKLAYFLLPAVHPRRSSPRHSGCRAFILVHRTGGQQDSRSADHCRHLPPADSGTVPLQGPVPDQQSTENVFTNVFRRQEKWKRTIESQTTATSGTSRSCSTAAGSCPPASTIRRSWSCTSCAACGSSFPLPTSWTWAARP